MPQALVFPFRLRSVKPRGALRAVSSEPRDASAAAEPVQSRVDVIAPDGYSTALLLELISPWFPAEVVSEDGWIVRLHTPDQGAGEAWVFEVLALVERWLDAVPLPSAEVRYWGRSYLIRPSSGTARLEAPPAQRMAREPLA